MTIASKANLDRCVFVVIPYYPFICSARQPKNLVEYSVLLLEIPAGDYGTLSILPGAQD
jgi:hypothetical protein